MLERQLGGRPQDAAGGVVDGDVDAPSWSVTRAAARGDAGGIGDVGLQRQRPPPAGAQLADQRLRGGVAAVIEDGDVAPAAASLRAIAAPMPRAPPVTSAILPSSGAAMRGDA